MIREKKSFVTIQYSSVIRVRAPEHLNDIIYLAHISTSKAFIFHDALNTGPFNSFVSRLIKTWLLLFKSFEVRTKDIML